MVQAVGYMTLYTIVVFIVVAQVWIGFTAYKRYMSAIEREDHDIPDPWNMGLRELPKE